MVFWGFLETLDFTTLKPGPYSLTWHTVISVLAFLCRLRFVAFVNNGLDPVGSGSLLWMRDFSVETCCYAAVGTNCYLLAYAYTSSSLLPSRQAVCLQIQFHKYLISFYPSKCTLISQLQQEEFCCPITACSRCFLYSQYFSPAIVVMFDWHLSLHWYNMGRGENCLCLPSWAVLLLAPLSYPSSWDRSPYAASERRMVLSCSLQFLVTAATGVAGWAPLAVTFAQTQ